MFFYIDDVNFFKSDFYFMNTITTAKLNVQIHIRLKLFIGVYDSIPLELWIKLFKSDFYTLSNKDVKFSCIRFVCLSVHTLTHLITHIK